MDDGARSVERIARVLGRPEAAPVAGGPVQVSARSGADAWGGTQAHIPRRSAAPWIVAAVLGACAVVGIAAVVVRGVRRAEPARSVTFIVASASAAAPDVTVVKLAPPSEPPPASASSPPSVEATAAAPHPKPGVPHGRPAPLPTVAVTTAPAPTPAPQPTPTQEPADPLHMGIK